MASAAWPQTRGLAGQKLPLAGACVELAVPHHLATAERVGRPGAQAPALVGGVVDRVVQVYGGAGYLAEYDAERFFRDARIYRIYEGTTQILQLQIAKHMLREWAAQG